MSCTTPYYSWISADRMGFMPERFSVAPGQRFGRLAVLEEVTKFRPSGAVPAARCICDCGAETIVDVHSLRRSIRSCGCLKRMGTMSETFRSTRGRPRLFQVEPGQRFGRLVVQREMKNAKGKWQAVCICDCGTESIVTLHNLKSGISTSCGCRRQQNAVRMSSKNATHALSGHEHYARWRNMLRRCEEPTDRKYPSYGARGISVCDEWHDVATFVTYLDEVLGPRPAGASLDRIDNDGNYEPGNVRWATPLMQRHNQRRGATWGIRTPRGERSET